MATRTRTASPERSWCSGEAVVLEGLPEGSAEGPPPPVPCAAAQMVTAGQVEKKIKANTCLLIRRYKGGYWEARECGDWTGCRDIFGPNVIETAPSQKE